MGPVRRIQLLTIQPTIRPLTNPRNTPQGNFPCVPSQNGFPPECLQAHHATVFASVISTFCGLNPVPLCEPSQNGWLFERPHAHHQYVPGSTFCTIGDFWKTMGLLMSYI
jgi:hypothetical protein